MSTEFIILIIVFIIGFSVMFWLSGKQKKDTGQDQSLLMLQNQLNEVTKTLDYKLGESNKMMQNQFGQSAKIIQDVTERLTKLDETNKQILGFSDQLQTLEETLNKFQKVIHSKTEDSIKELSL